MLCCCHRGSALAAIRYVVFVEVLKVVEKAGGRRPGNRNERTICMKNLTPEDILLHATRLRSALGRKVVKLKTRHVTKNPSVQGTWTTALKF
ncbi:hypothetical protein Drorol1_Dr00002987 [Drosera rotundifolia]